MKIKGHYKLHNMTKLGLTQECKVGLMMANQAN